MNRDEQRQILRFIQRVVQERPGAPLRPMDVEADVIIRAMFVRNPEAAYRITMLAMQQELELDALRARPVETSSRPLKNFFSRLFVRREITAPIHEAPLSVFKRSANG